MANSIVPSEFAVSYRLNHTDRQWTEQQYLKRNIDLVVNRNIRELIVSNEELHHARSDMLVSISKGLRDSLGITNENLEVISINLEEIISSLDVLNQNVVSGFQALFVKVEEINASLAHLGRSLDVLVEIAQTPVQTWAFNQYELARDSIRRKLFPEALDALNLAINGDAMHGGYKTDHRFHQMKGVLRLGIEGEPETAELINLVDAENAFLLAVRYAQHDDRSAAAQASIGAGKAAWRQGKLASAERNFFAALEFDQSCGEAHYQLARFYMEQKDLPKVESHLLIAFDLHWSFAMRAAADSLFIANSEIVERCVKSLSSRIIEVMAPKVSRLIKDTSTIKQLEDKNYPIDSRDTYQKLTSEIKTSVDRVRSQRLKSLIELRSSFPSLSSLPYEAAAEYSVYIESRMDEFVRRGQKPVPTGDPEDKATNLATKVGGAIICVVIGLFVIRLASELASDLVWKESAVGSVLLLLFVAVLSTPLLIIVVVLGAGGAWLIGLLTYVVAKESYKVGKKQVIAENQRRADENRAVIQERVAKLKRLSANLKPS